MSLVKICGITTPSIVTSACEAGARYLGFNFFPKSPRFASPELTRKLALDVPTGVMKVGLWVDPSDDELERYLSVAPLDMIQLHGSETPKRVLDIKQKYKLPIMKVIGVEAATDLEKLDLYEAADQFLLDAKAPKRAELPGGNGLSFDWTLLNSVKFRKPWMLAGGLNPKNVAEAIKLTGAKQVDVSSGVESAKGIKDKGLIEQFINAAQG